MFLYIFSTTKSICALRLKLFACLFLDLYTKNEFLDRSEFYRVVRLSESAKDLFEPGCLRRQAVSLIEVESTGFVRVKKGRKFASKVNR